MKEMTIDEIKLFRDRHRIPVSDEDIEKNQYAMPYYHPGQDAPEIKYMQERRQKLGGYVPERRKQYDPLPMPPESTYKHSRKGSGKQQIATTMAFVRLLRDLMRDKNIGKRIVPIIPDEARTFGMDSFFPTAKIYNPRGQHYMSVDREALLSYKESTEGQLWHVGINEAGATSAMTAAGTSYSTHGEIMIPIYIFYSMFGFQRTGDSFWAAADQLTRGFVIGATAGRTTLAGEGTQHMDGHSPILASTNPGVKHYDPAFSYEIAHIVRNGLHEMYGDHDMGDDVRNVMYYLTVYNEPITHQPEPENLDVDGLLKGIYRYSESDIGGPKANLFGSGVSLPWVIDAAEVLANDWGVSADVWSVTSWNELRRDAVAAERERLTNPDAEPRTPYITEVMSKTEGPVVATTDFMTLLPDQIRQYVPNEFATLGADDFGFSDTRAAARRFFKIDTHSVVVRALQMLEKSGEVEEGTASTAFAKYGLDDVNRGTTGTAGGDA